MENENTFKWRWTDNELDNSLFAELAKVQPSESVIRELVKKGANVNAIDCKHDTVIGDAISNLIHNDLDIKYIKLLIELGADVNVFIEGRNNSFDNALFSYRIDIFQLLLDAGADPNGISDEGTGTTLDAIEFDEDYCNLGGEEDKKKGKIMKEIGDLLIKYGAKRAEEFYADIPEESLIIGHLYATGLLTYKGKSIEPEKFIKDKALVEKFKRWKNNPLPKELDLQKEMHLEFNKKGYNIAKEIKSILGEDIVVKIYESYPRRNYKLRIVP